MSAEPQSPNPNKAKFAGVGIVFQGVRGEALVVQSLTAGGPAEISGLVEVGDVLFTIDDSKVADMDDSKCPLLIGIDDPCLSRFWRPTPDFRLCVSSSSP